MNESRVYPHSLAFGAYLAAMSAGLLLTRAWGYGMLFLAMLVAMLWLTRARLAAPGPRTLRREQFFFLVSMNVSYQAMAGAVPVLRAVRYDGWLLHADRWLFGETPCVMTANLVTPALTEVMSLCYIFFMPLLFVSMLRYFFAQRERLVEFYTGLFTVYGIGFLGYLLVPAAGPHLAFPGLFHVPLDGGPITDLNRAMVDNGSNHVDAWPSLHVAVSAFILGFAHRHHRREFWWLLLPVTGLWFSTIYLRYHYLVDVICGFGLAAAALMISRSVTSPTGRKVANVHPA
jgi:membrane-associated phospholipid phosphatase